MSASADDGRYAGGPRPGAPPREGERHVYDAVHARISPRSEVLRLLPTRARRMVGAWCFADIYGPRPVGPQDAGEAMHVAPHPHTGLQTVSWLVSGQVTHRDSLGTTAVVTPGRVAVMTAGVGIAHAEDVVGSPDGTATLHGAQLWVALPDAERGRPADFVLHEPAPSWVGEGVAAQVFIGAVGGAAGAAAYSPLVGAELTPRGGGSGRLPLDPTFEHALIPLAGWAEVEGARTGHGQAMYLGLGRDHLDLGLADDARVLLLGGKPFEEDIVMWWNFVARTHEEIEQARAQWNAGGDPRFGEVEHYPTGERLAAPPLPNVRLHPRSRIGAPPPPQ
ncbi:MAG: pirin family protein, partial [Lapillicoccus sp.]